MKDLELSGIGSEWTLVHADPTCRMVLHTESSDGETESRLYAVVAQLDYPPKTSTFGSLLAPNASVNFTLAPNHGLWLRKVRRDS